MKPGEWVRVASLVSLIELSLITSYLRKPHFVVFGVMFVEGFPALLVAGGLMAAFLSFSILLLKRGKKVYGYAKVFSLMMALNSFLSLASVILLADISYFLKGLGEGAVIGFVFTEALVLACSIALFFMVGQSKKALE